MSKRSINHLLAIVFICATSACVSDKSVDENNYFGSFNVPAYDTLQLVKYDSMFFVDRNYVNDFGLAKYDRSACKSLLMRNTFPRSSFMSSYQGIDLHFFPLDQDTAKSYQYVHEYECLYESDSLHRYAEVAYPSPCLGEDIRQPARVFLDNQHGKEKTLYCRLFYQNVSYGFTTSPKADFVNKLFLSNHYGMSEVVEVKLKAEEQKNVTIPFQIGMDPKKTEEKYRDFYGPARSGSYEFMLFVSSDTTDHLMKKDLSLEHINPFAEISTRLLNNDSLVLDQVSYIDGKHFKFYHLKEDFKGNKTYKPGKIFYAGNRDEKPLCDTCTGYFKDIISDGWTTDDFFKGNIHKASFVKVPYGNRVENLMTSPEGIYMKSPGSTKSSKQKTWGEVKFMPAFKYGTVKIVAKLSQLRNKVKTPTGIVHNLWLYQRRPNTVHTFPGHPYEHLTNSRGKQPFEIDIEIWSKIYEENWNGGSNINYSIVDYMRDPNVQVKPGEEKELFGYKIDRFNNVQLNQPDYTLLERDFFDQYHLFEIIWNPYDVIYKIDGQVRAKIDWRMAKIPDSYAFLWIGSPIYQDGTFYAQNSIPFYPEDLFTHVRYISIE